MKGYTMIKIKDHEGHVIDGPAGREFLQYIADRVANLVIEAGEDGLTTMEVAKESGFYRALRIRDSDEVERLMKLNHGIRAVEIDIQPGGRGVLAYVAPQQKKVVGGSIIGDGEGTRDGLHPSPVLTAR